jgi:hypothetical protein
MSFALLDATTFVDDYDFTGDTNKITLAPEVEDQDGTVFGGGGWKKPVGGLRAVTAGVEGFWQGPVDAEGFSDLGNANRVVTASPTGLAQSVAYFFQATKLKYSAFGQVGDLVPFTLDMSGSSTAGMVRGQVAAAKQTVSAAGALGSAVQLGAVGASQFVYAAFHVFGTPGTTITVKVQSDNASGFPSATDVATIGPLTTAGGVWMTRVAGPLTDDWFRFSIPVAGITGTFTVAGAIAVQ